MSAATVTPAAPRIELEKPTALVVDGERYDRGERVITVNGQPWGRTLVSHHGVHGAQYRIKQLNGEPIIKDPNAKYPREVSISSSRFRARRERDMRPTEEVIIETARELVAAGRLRDPAVVKAEQVARAVRYRERQAEGERREAAEFRAKALEAAGYTGEPNDPQSVELVDRVVAAMRWAQTK